MSKSIAMLQITGIKKGHYIVSSSIGISSSNIRYISDISVNNIQISRDSGYDCQGWVFPSTCQIINITTDNSTLTLNGYYEPKGAPIYPISINTGRLIAIRLCD